MSDTAGPTEATLANRASTAFAAYRDGDSTRMGELIDLLSPILWHTARAQGVNVAVAEDVVQTAWLRLVESSDRINDTAAVMKWLIVTVRRECWRQRARERRVESGHELLDEPDRRSPGVEAEVLAGADAELIWRHVRELSQRCRALLRVIAFADRPDYGQVSQALGMPVGSIGPTRGRCLAKLRAALAADPEWSVQ